MSPNKKTVAQHMSIYGMMFRKRSHVSTKFTQINYVKSSDLIKPPENSSKDTSSKFHPICAWRSKKCKSFSHLPQRSRGVPRHVPHGGTVDTEAAAVVAAEDVHSIGHVAPHGCVVIAGYGRRSARGQLTPAIGLPKVAQMFRRDQ